MNETEIFYPESLAVWREWLEKNHISKTAVWLVFHTRSSGKFSLTWSDAVDIALCFGWIDSKKIKIDEGSSHQFFSKRKVRSTWSKINKEKVQRLIDGELMTAAGYKSIEVAKQNGSWTLLDEVEELIIPDDLEKTFEMQPGSKDYFLNLSKTTRKMMLHWVVMAKKPETRQKRINEIAEHAAQGKKPKQF